MDGGIFMILGHLVNIDQTLKLSKDQGHKVKGQGHIFVLCKILVSAINHERLDGS